MTTVSFSGNPAARPLSNKFRQTVRQAHFGAVAWTPKDAAALKDDLKNNRVVFWDVDTQRGFMWPIILQKIDGALRRIGLTVPGADAIVDNLKKLTQLTQQFKIPLVATLDTHEKNDPEFRHFVSLPDGSPLSTEHCVKGAADWPKIPETTPTGTPHTIDVNHRRKDVPSPDELREIFARGQSIALEKNTLSAFQRRIGKSAEKERFVTNKKAVELVENMKAIGIRTAVVYGVATDFCVQKAVEGLKKLGIRPIVVEDAIQEIIPATNPLLDPNDLVYGDVTVVKTEEVEKAVDNTFEVV